MGTINSGRKTLFYLSLILFLMIVDSMGFGMAKREGNFVLNSRSKWYRDSFYLVYLEAGGNNPALRGEISADEIRKFVKEIPKMDALMVTFKHNDGLSHYPTECGYVSPAFKQDMVKVYRDIATEMKIPFNAYYNIGRDKQIMEKRPEFNRLNINGKLADRALSYSTGVAQEYLWPQIREIMKKYNPDGFWFDGSCFTVENCFQPICKEQFKKLTGKEAPTSPDSNEWEMYKQIHRQIYRDFIHDTANMIRKINPRCLVAFNYAYSLWMPEKPDEGMDYLSVDICSNVDVISSEARFLDSQGLPFEVMVLPVTALTLYLDGTENKSRFKPFEQIEQEIALIMANGGKYHFLDQYLLAGGLSHERIEYYKKIDEWLSSREKWCRGFSTVPDASVLHIADAHYALNKKTSRCFVGSNPPVRGVSKALNENHINHQIIADWRLIAGPVLGKLLVVENPCVLPEKAADAIHKFAENGGKVLITAKGGESNARMFERLAGIRKVSFVGKKELKITGTQDVKDVNINSDFYEVIPKDAKVLIAAEISGRPSQKHPLLTQFNVGKGEVYYCSVPVFTEDKATNIPQSFKKMILDIVLPDSQRLINFKGHDAIEVSLREKNNCYVVHLTNVAKGNREGEGLERIIRDIPPAGECQLTLKLAQKPVSVMLQPVGKKLDYIYHNGRVEITVPPFNGRIHQMVIVEQ